jgi:signal transduction histidine kinase
MLAQGHPCATLPEVASTLIFLGFSLILSAGIWWTWRQRELAQRQAEMNARLAELGKSLEGLAHDIAQLVNLLLVNMQMAWKHPDESSPSLSQMERAAEALRKLVEALQHPETAQAEHGSTEGVLRLVSGLFRGKGTILDLRIRGDMPFHGSHADAVRLIQNLLANAVHEASRFTGGHVQVELARDGLRISNPVREPSRLDESIYEPRVSHSSSTGFGLDISRRAARRLGWSLAHEVHGQEVTFFVRPTSPPS